MASVVRGDSVDPARGTITFRRWFEEWAEAQDWTPGTAETETVVLDSVTFADVPMKRVTEHHVREWMKAMRLPGSKRKAGLAASTRRPGVPLQLRLVTLLASHVQTVGTLGDEGCLFSCSGNVHNRSSAGFQWRQLRSKVGMGDLTLHDLRHFFASG